jgi:propanol-preferring alcohol dehydrogenase
VDSAHHLVPLGDLDQVQNVSLTDAGQTPFTTRSRNRWASSCRFRHRCHRSRRPGHVGIQLLHAITSATVAALDLNEEKLGLAKEVGAPRVPFRLQRGGQVRERTGGRGAHAVFDFLAATRPWKWALP